MPFFGFIDVITETASTIHEHVDNSINTIYNENKAALDSLNASKDQFAEAVAQQWQQQQSVVTGAVLKLASDSIAVVATGASAVDSGLNNYLGVDTTNLKNSVQQIQVEAAQHLQSIAAAATDKVTELAQMAVLAAVEQAHSIDASKAEVKKLEEQAREYVVAAAKTQGL